MSVYLRSSVKIQIYINIYSTKFVLCESVYFLSNQFSLQVYVYERVSNYLQALQ